MVASVPEALLRRLRELLGPRGYVDDSDDLASHLVEWRGLYQGATPAMLRPSTTAEVAAVVDLCGRHGVGLVPQGGNTSLCGGSVPPSDGSALLLSLSRMNRIRAVDPVGDTMTVEAGCVLADLHRAAEAQDRIFPLRLAAEGSCQIGGNLSTNAGGVNVIRYGNTRDLVLGVEVVLPDGRVLDQLSGLRKDNTGYDLKHLFIGAEGTLGVITAAVLELFPRPRARWTGWVALPSVDAGPRLLASARSAVGDAISSFELVPRIAVELVTRHFEGTSAPLGHAHPWYVLVELESASGEAAWLESAAEAWLARASEEGLATDAAIARSAAQRDAFWLLRESISEAQKKEGASVKHDVSVPVEAVPRLIERASEAVAQDWPGVRVVAFGHLGDGNVHFNLSQPVDAEREPFLAHWSAFNRIVHDIVHDLGGSFSAEHGVGVLKRDELLRYEDPVALDLMRRLKTSLDPKGIMNPGRVIEVVESRSGESE